MMMIYRWFGIISACNSGPRSCSYLSVPVLNDKFGVAVLSHFFENFIRYDFIIPAGFSDE